MECAVPRSATSTPAPTPAHPHTHTCSRQVGPLPQLARPRAARLLATLPAAAHRHRVRHNPTPTPNPNPTPNPSSSPSQASPTATPNPNPNPNLTLTLTRHRRRRRPRRAARALPLGLPARSPRRARRRRRRAWLHLLVAPRQLRVRSTAWTPDLWRRTRTVGPGPRPSLGPGPEPCSYSYLCIPSQPTALYLGGPRASGRASGCTASTMLPSPARRRLACACFGTSCRSTAASGRPTRDSDTVTLVCSDGQGRANQYTLRVRIFRVEIKPQGISLYCSALPLWDT